MPFDYSLFNQPVMATPPAPTPTQTPHPSPPPDPAPVGSLRRSQFPSCFTFGTATSAFQIEGAVNEDGRLRSIWDTFAEEQCLEGWEQAVDHYHRYREDVKIMKVIGLDAYRFSISWPRILPKGTEAGGVNPAGIAFYNNLINELVANDIEPVATLFHWDLPQALEDEYGGFRDRRIIEDFQNYADVCFREFGDRVKTWITLNEPWSFSFGGYAVGTLAPGRGYFPEITKGAEGAEGGTSIADLLPPSPYSFPSSNSRCPSTTPVGDPGREPYVVTHYQLLCHGAAVKLYREKYQNTYNGKIGITLVTNWTEPYSKKRRDILAAKRAQDFMFGWFMDPITKGDYPRSMRVFVGERLPKFTKEESRLLIGSFDFLGLNYYTARYVEDAPDLLFEEPHYVTDPKVKYITERDGQPIGPQGGSEWLYVYPIGIYNLLMHIQHKYNNPLIHITENGLDDKHDLSLPLTHFLFDEKRVAYHHDHLHYIKVAIERGSNVNGYYTWSILDNFEWGEAFNVRFGTTYIDFKNGSARYPKLSSGWLKFFLNA